jgi:hypothetical protein
VDDYVITAFHLRSEVLRRVFPGIGLPKQVLTANPASGFTFEWGALPTPPAPGSLDAYDLVFSLAGFPDSGRDYPVIVFTRAVVFAANFSGSVGSVGTNPFSSAIFTVKQNGSMVGTATVSNTGVFTFSSSGGNPVTFNIGDRLTLQAPVPQDPLMQDVFLTLVGSRSVTTPYDIVFSVPGQPDALDYPVEDFPQAVTFQADFAGSQASAGTNPTADTTYTIQKNLVGVGTLVIHSDGSFVFTSMGHTTVTYLVGDRMTIVAPSPQDATLSDVAITLAGDR